MCNTWTIYDDRLGKTNLEAVAGKAYSGEHIPHASWQQDNNYIKYYKILVYIEYVVRRLYFSYCFRHHLI